MSNQSRIGSLGASMAKKKAAAAATAAAAVIGGLTLNRQVGAVPFNLTGINHFSESNTFTASTYTSTDPTPGSPSFPHIITREFTNSGAYEIVPFIRVSLSSVPAGQQITGAQLGLFFTDSTYFGGAALRQEYIDLWSVKDAFDPATVNMTTYDSNATHLWSDGFRAGVNHVTRTGPAGSFLSTVWPTQSAPAGTPSAMLNNGADEYKIWSSDQLDDYLTAQHLQGKDAYFELTNSNASGNAYRFVATGDANAMFGTHYDAAHQPYLSFEAAPLVHRWRLNDSGAWSAAQNWFGRAIPGGADAPVVFGSWTDVAGIVYPQGSIAVNVDSPRTVGHVTFDTPETYNISGTNPLTLDVGSGSATIDVLNGSQIISAPVVLNKNTTVTVAASAPSLTLSGELTAAAGVTLTKAGGGILQVNHVRADGLSINEGTLLVTPNATASGVSKVATLDIAGEGKLDLSDNKLIVTTAGATGSWTGSNYDGITGQVATARGDGTWNGTTGITTSLANGKLTGLAVAKAGDVEGIADGDTATFAGQTVHGSDTIVMYTYGGDANLDGKINIDDYGRIDSNVGFNGTVHGWYNGDFNYDGAINIDDYGIIDSNIGIQGPPIPTEGTGAAITGASAVPEPASLGSLFVAAAFATAQCRRRRRLSHSSRTDVY
jgi:hypothetical protein